VLQEDNIDEGSKYFYLTRLAAECTAKRMVPDYISEKMALSLKGDCYPCMGCRSFLTPDRFTDARKGNLGNAKNFVEGVHKYYGRFNQGVVTINLVDAACSSGGDEVKFWEIMKDRLDLCHRALRLRHERLLGTPSDVAPILWQDGALARLKPGEVIDRLLYDGYSTISLGYAGLAECVYYMKGVSHTSAAGEAFGLKVMQLLNDSCAQWKAEENIDYSVYGTPLESTTYKFAKALQKRFGKIPHVTDKNYITNSYHIHVTEKIDAFSKLTKEAEFQRLSPGGAISYVEVPNLQTNLPAVLAIMKHIYNTILYAELNTKSDLCDVCGYSGEIRVIKDSTGKLIWECPNCGNREQTRMHVARRTCGYIGTQYWNQGRTAEIADRVLHIGLGEIPDNPSVNPNSMH
jgi:ribonucleoside-triphosphate reductase